jgi:hypothetical protein
METPSGDVNNNPRLPAVVKIVPSKRNKLIIKKIKTLIFIFK